MLASLGLGRGPSPSERHRITSKQTASRRAVPHLYPTSSRTICGDLSWANQPSNSRACHRATRAILPNIVHNCKLSQYIVLSNTNKRSQTCLSGTPLKVLSRLRSVSPAQQNQDVGTDHLLTADCTVSQPHHMSCTAPTLPYHRPSNTVVQSPDTIATRLCHTCYTSYYCRLSM